MGSPDVRVHICETFVGKGHPPSVAQTADALGISRDEAAGEYRGLRRAGRTTGSLSS